MVNDLMCPTNDSLHGTPNPSPWLLLILALDPSKRQSQSSPISLPHPSHTLWWWPQGIRTLLLQIMSLACSLYTIRPIRRTRGLGLPGGLEERKADAATEPHWTEARRRIVTCMTTCEGSEPRRCYHMLRNEWDVCGIDCLIE